MNKQELITELADKADLPKSHVGRVLEALGEVATDQLSAGEDVALPGLGKLSTGTRAARTVKSPLVGGTKHVPARRVAKFKPSSALKTALN